MVDLKEKHDHEKQDKNMLKEYELLQKKYSLPSFSEIDKEFSIGNLDQTEFVFRPVLAKIHERYDFTLKLLIGIVQPDSHISDMQESEQFSDSQRQVVFELYKRLLFLEKEFLIRDFDYDEAKSAEFIKTVFNEWKKIKPEILKTLLIMQSAWKTTNGTKQSANYFG